MRVSVAACIALSSLLAACGGGGGTLAQPSTPLAPSAAERANPALSADARGRRRTPIGHVVIIFQENRTPDNLFQGLAGADIASSGLDSRGETIPLRPIPLANTYDIDHSHTGFLRMYDGGKMDGADTVSTSCGAACPYEKPQYGFVPAIDNAPYMQMARRYTFGDRMFQTNEGPSYPAHQYILAGTSKPSDGSDLLVSENTASPGCGPTGGTLVNAIEPSGNESIKIPSCFEHAALPDLLDAKGVSWRYYAPSNVREGSPGIWVAPNSIRHLRLGPDWANVVAPETTILSDVANGTLAQVSWVIPSGLESDHAKSNNGTGPSWVASVVNAIGRSKYWNDTAIFVTWDDWGGWYDHVAPPILGSYELGFRVPLLVISPHAKRGYVSHVQHEFGSILKFTENTFDLGSLGFTDVRSDDLSDCFDFDGPARAFQPIESRRSTEFFRTRAPDPTAPDNDS